MMRLFKKYISVHKPATIIYDETFYQILRETARHPIVLRMKLYPHHGTTNCYIHCLHVAYFNYKWCKALGLDYESAEHTRLTKAVHSRQTLLLSLLLSSSQHSLIL